MKSSIFSILFSILIFIACQNPSAKESPANARPNIILIMGDDMGYSDLGCYGGEIRTPNLDKLAANGLRFTNFYNTARCCPTRASLMTGLYPQQAGVGHMVNDRGTPAYQGDLSANAVTIGEALKPAGYSTYLSGKWHITPYVVDNPDKKNWPRQRGFDKFFGMISGAGSLYDPRSLCKDNEYVAPREGFYSTTDFTNYAIQCIEEHQMENPYFLYVSYQSPHWPLQAPAEAIAKYKGQYDKGWDAVRKERFERMKKMGLVESGWEMTPRDAFVEPWSENIPDKEWELANMETYAAMTTVMDEGIGQIVKALEAKGELDNTLILFLQDNGACAEDLSWIKNRPDEKDRVTLKPNELQTEMVPFMTRDGKPVRLMKGAMPGPPESYTAYGYNWANVSNTPFREYKHWVHEGGISTPLIAHWPTKIKDNGAFRAEPSHLIDIMATCLDIAGATYPRTYNGNEITALAGKSLLPVFANKKLDRKAIYWEHEGNRAVRMGKWKLVSKVSKKDAFVWDKIEVLPIENWELFDMEKDRTEMHNIAAEYPEKVKEMAQMWMDWAKEAGALPRPL